MKLRDVKEFERFIFDCKEFTKILIRSFNVETHGGFNFDDGAVFMDADSEVELVVGSASETETRTIAN